VILLKLSDFTGRPCKSRTAYEFLPNKKTIIDLTKAAGELRKEYYIEIETKVLLMIKVDGATVSLFPSGKILVRGEKEEAKAREIAEKVVKFIG